MKNIFKPLDLTEGKIWKVLIAFAFPILISYFFQQLYTVTDAAICGFYLSSNEVAGIGNVGSITFMVMQFAFGCTGGFSVVTANAIGKKDVEQCRKALLCQMILSAIISIVLTAVSLIFLKPILNILGVNEQNNAEIFNASYTYTSIIFWFCISQVFYNLGCCFLRSLGNSKTPLFFLIASTIVNIGLDLLFIAVFKLGVAGAALATIISQTLSAVACFIYIFTRLKEYRFKKSDFHFEKGFIKRHLKLGLPLGFQLSILSIGLIIMQAMMIKFDLSPDGETLGNEVQLGYTTACRFAVILMQPYLSIAAAVVSFVGQNYGANRMDRVKKGVVQALIILLICYVILVTFGLLMTIDGAYLKIFLSEDKITPTTIKYGNFYLHTCLPFHILLGLVFVLRNTLQGLEKPLFPFISGIAELFSRSLVVIFLPPLVNGGPINSLASDQSFITFCFGDNASWFTAVVILVIGIVIYFYHLHKIEKNNNDFRQRN